MNPAFYFLRRTGDRFLKRPSRASNPPKIDIDSMVMADVVGTPQYFVGRLPKLKPAFSSRHRTGESQPTQYVGKMIGFVGRAWKHHKPFGNETFPCFQSAENRY